MSRRPYVHLAGDTWGVPLGFAPQEGHLRALDQYSSELVNGEDGGVWAPEEPIVLGPQADPSISLTTSGSVLSGDVETVLDNELGNDAGFTPGLILQSSALPAFSSPRSRKVLVGFGNALDSNPYSASARLEANTAIDPVTFAASGRATGLNACLSVALPLRAQHRGATIDQVDFRVRLAGHFPAGVPATPLKFRVLRATDFSVAYLHTAAGQYDADGWLSDPAATVGAYTNNGEIRTISYVPNQHHSNIDPDGSYYVVQARCAIAQTPGILVTSATVHLSNITNYAG